MSPGKPCGLDHIPIITKISTNPITIYTQSHYNYNKAGWETFQTTLENNHTPPLLNNQHHFTLDTHIDNLHAEILNSADLHIPKIRHKFVQDFKLSIRTQRLLTCYHNTFERNKHNHYRVHRDLQFLRQHIINSLKEDHNRHWTNLIRNIESYHKLNPTLFWQHIRRLSGSNYKQFQYLTHNNRKISQPDEVTNIFKKPLTNSI